MQRTVAQPFRPVAGAIAVLQHDIDALLLEEAQLDRRGGDEIRRRIEIGDREPEHPKQLP